MSTTQTRQLPELRRRVTSPVSAVAGLILSVVGLAACDNVRTSAGDVGSGERSAAVLQYTQYIQQERVRDRGGPDAQYVTYVAGGIRRLAAASDATAEGDSVLEATVRPRLATLRARAADVEQAADGRWPARDARDAFLLATELLEQAHELRRSGPRDSAHLAAVRRAAESLRPREQLVMQQPEVQAFLERAGDVLRDVTER